MTEFDLRALLLAAGEQLTETDADDIVALGSDAEAILLGILSDEDLLHEDAPGQGWAPVHAAVLLGDLQCAAAIPRLIELLLETDIEEPIHEAAADGLSRIGPAVLEPVLACIEQAQERDDEDLLFSLGFILARCGVQDRRIRKLLVENLDRDALIGADDIGAYGDRSLVPDLAEAYDTLPIEPTKDEMGNQDLIELRAAILELGGSMTAEQEAKYATLMLLRKARERRALPGRNEPCWCGSGTKYKKCHMQEDEAK